MNVISQLRREVQHSGVATIDIDRFNQLQAEWITRAKIDPWISVKDRLPMTGETVLMTVDIDDEPLMVMSGFYNSADKKWYYSNECVHCLKLTEADGPVLYWQSLPAPPKESEK